MRTTGNFGERLNRPRSVGRVVGARRILETLRACGPSALVARKRHRHQLLGGKLDRRRTQRAARIVSNGARGNDGRRDRRRKQPDINSGSRSNRDQRNQRHDGHEW